MAIDSSVATLGLISDTHGRLRPEALTVLRGCNQIIHAGDIGDREILDSLSELAPIVAIKGNIDRGWTASLPETAILEWQRTRIYVLHNLKALDIALTEARIQIVVSGHSHKPAISERSGVLFINPGTAGPQRFRLPITVARLNLTSRIFEVSIINLLTGEYLCTTTMAK